MAGIGFFMVAVGGEIGQDRPVLLGGLIFICPFTLILTKVQRVDTRTTSIVAFQIIQQPLNTVILSIPR